ncbi:unnamed protein product [Caenorhabditis sp. 36 PRJEB53466]|nr:unnamed protein product [Caenorhabditis sp. 36 PRJEB53466]
MPAAASPSSTRCLICEAQATGFHFEAQSCSACAAFFRRTVALTKQFTCITGRDDCHVHYSMHQICRSCRHRKCLDSGMKPAGVQPKKGGVETGRAFFTKSGLKRNKKFSTVSPITDAEQKLVVATKVPKIEVLEANVEWGPGKEDVEEEEISEILRPSARKISFPTSYRSNAPSVATTPSPIGPLGGFSTPMSQLSPHRATISQEPKSAPDALAILIREEMKLGERRRLLFSDASVKLLLGLNKNCPYSPGDIKPLVFNDYRLTIKTHIMLVYEWLQAWPELQELEEQEKVSLLRKVVLIHFLLDPSFLTYQIGDPDKLIMQNGGYISTSDYQGVGWEDEEDISGENKRKYYVPIMKQIIEEIMPSMQAMKITFEEFVALKALASFQGGFENVSEAKRPFITQQVNRILGSLHKYYLDNNMDFRPERFGTIVLMLGNIFTAGNDFVQNHREIDIFHIWDFTKLGKELINFDSNMEQEAREEQQAKRNNSNRS